MATLEKIRSKSVLLIVVIGVALLAFIVGDALTNSRNIFGDRTTIAKVGNEKIDYTEYQAKMNELNNQLEEARRQNPMQMQNFDTQVLSQIAIQQLIDEKLLDAAVKKNGIRVSSDQLRYYMIEQPVNPNLNTLIMQMSQNGLLKVQEGAMPSQLAAQAYEILFNPKRNGLTEQDVEPFQRRWLQIEEETKQMIRRNTYQRILFSSVQANDLDKRNLYNDYVKTLDVDLAYKPVGKVDEKKYPVSDADIKAEYDRVKAQRYAVKEPTKSVSFIAVSVTPSDADRKASAELAKNVVKQLNDSNGQVSKQTRKEGVNVERKRLRASDVAKTPVGAWVANAPADSVKVISEDLRGFTIVKMGRRTMETDSIQLNLVQVIGKNLPNRVLASLNAGLPIDSVMSRFSADSVMVQKQQWFPLFNAQGAVASLSSSQLDSLNAVAQGRYISLMTEDQGAVLAAVTKKNAPVTIVEFDEVTYNLQPSSATVNAERNRLEKFLNANTTASKFAANASKSGFNAQDLELTPSTPAVPLMRGIDRYYPDSRQVVRWVVMDAKAGDVSHVYESKNPQEPRLYAVAVLSEYDDFIPVEQVKDELTAQVRNSKAAADMEKQYAGKGDMAQTAAAMGVEVQNIPAYRLGGNNGVYDADVMGKIAGSKPGKVVVVKGKNGVYAYRVNSQKQENFPYDDASYEQQYLQLMNPNIGQMLRGSKKVENNIYKFEAGE